jgi:hypothetical protein
MYTADPSAHVFEGKVYIYPSHDRETDIQFNDNGDQYDMADYHVFSTPSLHPTPGEVTDHGVVLRAEDVPWVSKQLWAPDCAQGRDGKFYLYFPARDKQGIFRIGVAVGDAPEGPFTPEPEPIRGSFSIDPAAFVDEDGQGYLYFGGLWGGQLQCYQKGNDVFDPEWQGPKEVSGEGVPAQGPKVGKLTADMRQFDGEVQEIAILDPETGKPSSATTTTAASSRLPGCTSAATPTTSPTPPATPTSSATPPPRAPSAPSPTAAASSSPSWAGPPTTPSSSSRAAPTCSTTTASSARASTTCAPSRSRRSSTTTRARSRPPPLTKKKLHWRGGLKKWEGFLCMKLRMT